MSSMDLHVISLDDTMFIQQNHVFYCMKPVSLQEIYSKAKVGAVAGLIGGFVILVSFFAIDSLVVIPTGTFYMIAGLAVGLHGMAAIIFGFIAHMLTAATIGAVFCVCSTLHRALNLTSVWKGIFAGGVTGLEVYVIFFMPITLYMMIPTIDSLVSSVGQSTLTAQEHIVGSVLKTKLDTIMWGALVLHMLFGSVMGLFSGIMLQKEYKTPKNIYQF